MGAGGQAPVRAYLLGPGVCAPDRWHSLPVDKLSSILHKCPRLVGCSGNAGGVTMVTVWSRWQRSLALVVVFSLTFSLLVPPALAQSNVSRQVLGTIHSHNNVEIAESSGAWKPAKAGSPLVENTFIRTGQDGAGLLDLGQDGVIGLYPESRLFVGSRAAGVVPVGLEAGELAFRLPQNSKVELRTSAGIIRPSGVVAAATGGFIEGFLAVTAQGETSVRVQNGSLMVRSTEGSDFLPVKAGQEVKFGASYKEPKIIEAAAPALGQDPAGKSQLRPAERGRAIPNVFAENPELAALIGGLAVTGGVLGGLAAAGTFDGNDNEASPSQSGQ